MLAQIVDRIGVVAGDFRERGVVENHVGRHAVALRGLRAPSPQPLPAGAFTRGAMPVGRVGALAGAAGRLTRARRLDIACAS